MLLAKFQKIRLLPPSTVNLLHGRLIVNLRMLNDNEKSFLKYWEDNRDKQKHFLYQLLSGLPFGLLFALPVLVAVIFHDWYKTMVYISDSQVIVIIAGVIIIAIFFSIFRMKFKWEHNEQVYKELKYKEGKDHAADI